ncbi:MAG: Porphobilinogen deaminase [Chlamydiia bacterium]|nr:Porphobilinogen deaminase [Chlamydiia bacterium]MCH9614979.1 Porphobilinogen deaminase [Chlamydiia bacterium]MCH9629971.1 Porphobilinogen deaminase [Chlamydiia bacterium]
MEPIVIAARDSALSKVQVQEVLSEYNITHPIQTLFLSTIGDRDLKTSLRALDKTDFFTRDIDHLLLNHKADLAIHSAKDLPDPLPEGLELITLTTGVDPRDVLVLRKDSTLETLMPGALIATSSEKREEAVRTLRDDLNFTDIRGPIHARLLKLITGQVDGVVIAEAALIRLNLTHLTRVYLPGKTTQHQGRLALVTQAGNQQIKDLFLT